MKYLILAIINTIYGALLLSTLTPDTPGFVLVLIVGSVLAVMGLVGFVLWARLAANVSRDVSNAHAPIKSWFSLAKSFDVVLVIGLLFKALILQPFIVEGSSMEPNFHDKEIMLVDKISYRFKTPVRGDVIVFKAPKNPGEDYIKRIIGLPGETVQIAKGEVFINGVLLNENYLSSSEVTDNETGKLLFSQTLKTNQYFVLGDNRGNSSDSRTWGVMPRANLIGRAWWNIYPFSSFGRIKTSPPVIEKDQILQNYLSATFNFANM